MKKFINLFFLALVSFSLSGCGEEEEQIKSVEWWIENTDERKEKLEECSGENIELDSSQLNCLNAEEAELKIRMLGSGEESSQGIRLF